MLCFCLPPREKRRSRLAPEPEKAMAATATTKTASGESEGTTTDDDVQLSPSSVCGGRGSGRLKLLCSFGGRILPRPSDGSLKYVGGETRVLAVPRSVRFPEMKKKVEEMFKTEVAAIKYQLLAEDVDVLVSVTCDEDLAHMRDEYDRLEAKRSPSASPRFRLYLFGSPSTSPSAASATSATARHAGPAHHHHFQPEPYVEAVHAVTAGSPYLGRQVIGPEAVSAGNSPRAIATEQAAVGMHRVRSTPNLGGSLGHQYYHRHTPEGGGSPGFSGGHHLFQSHYHHQCCCCCCHHNQYSPAFGPVPHRAGPPGRYDMRGYARRGYYPPSPAARPVGPTHFRHVEEAGPSDHQIPTTMAATRGGRPFSETPTPRKVTTIWD